MIKKFALSISVLTMIAGASAYWGYQQIESYIQRPIDLKENILLQVPEGRNYYSFTRQLVDEQLIEASPWSRWAIKLYPELGNIKAGSYMINSGLTLNELFSQVSSGKEHQFSITFVEGSTFNEWRAQLKKTPYLSHDSTTLTEAQIADELNLTNEKVEGYLLPETYHFVAGESDLDILKRAKSHMSTTLDTIWQDKADDIPIKDKHELLTLASIIEKETALGDERGLVASVFVNRLNKKMRLQTDPTVIYGMGDAYNGNITRKDLRTATPYNTYVIYGLPPTPIAMPGRASIEAAAKPADSTYFYFVADGKGGHVFSDTLTEHNKAVRAYLKTLREKK